MTSGLPLSFTGDSAIKDQIKSVWEATHNSFWFVPTVMAICAVIAAFIAVHLDRTIGSSFANSVGFIWSGGADGARSLLSTIAGSMITVAGTVFSITIVALTLASSQFGPRILRNFVRDTGVQITLGTFTATFLYCVFVLRTVRAVNEGGFIPSLAITIALALAIASLGVLIYFIHHVSASIQAENVIAKIGAELCTAVDEHFPMRTTADSESQSLIEESWNLTLSSTRFSVKSSRSGYLQSINRSSLLEIARKHDLRLEISVTPGDFIVAQAGLLDLWWRNNQTPDPDICDKLRSAFDLGRQRTEEQDVRYGARELAEIAARALSPGINDPYTAMGCLDWISDTLARVAERGKAPELSVVPMGPCASGSSPLALPPFVR